MFRLLYPFLTLLTTLIAGWLPAQVADTSKPNGLSLGMNAMYGFFMANQSKAYYIRNDHSRMLELNLSRQTNGQRAWHAQADFPRTGIALIFGGVGSSEQIGNVLAVYPYVQFPLLLTQKMITSFRIGAGAGWVQKPYDKVSNFKNLMIGTHVNATISLRVQTEWNLSRSLSLNTGINFTHLSNGSIRLPNLGLNIPAISLGLRYHGSEKKIADPRDPPAVRKYLRYSLQAAGAFKQSYPLESKPGFVSAFQFEVFRDYRNSSRFGAGLMLSKDNSLSHEQAFAYTYLFDKSESQWQAGLYLAYHYRFGRISIPLQFGTYLYNNYKISQVFQHIGLRYHIDQHWVAGVHLKTHFGSADYIQYGIGYEF